MGKQSKTAAAAAKAIAAGEANKPKAARTWEQTLKNIRNLRAAHLAVPYDQVDELLAQYDKILAVLVQGERDLSALVEETIFRAEKAVSRVVLNAEGDSTNGNSAPIV